MKSVVSAIALTIAVAWSFPVLAANDSAACSSGSTTSDAAACEGLFTGNSYVLALAGLGAVGFIASRRRKN